APPSPRPSAPEGEAPGDRPPAPARAPYLPADHPPMPGAQRPAGATPSSFDPERPAVAGVIFTASSPLVYRAPESAMRAAEYVVEGSDQAVLGVFFFPGGGGGVEANVARWVGQFAPAEPTVTEATVHNLPVTQIDVSGSYQGMAIPGRPVAGPQADHRMLAAIVEGPQGPVFFKLVGPADDVSRAEDAFEALVASFRAAE
ncbi:MAG: hypothetical protein ACFCGT_11025, partial [Sandaracinaceae bacterium]